MSDVLNQVAPGVCCPATLELRDEGHDIVTHWETTPTGKRCARYVLRPPATLWVGLEVTR